MVRNASGLLSMGETSRWTEIGSTDPESVFISAIYETIFKPGVKRAVVFNRIRRQNLFPAFGLAVLMRAQNPALEHVRRFERHHPARQDRHFLAGLRIAADALVLGTD